MGEGSPVLFEMPWLISILQFPYWLGAVDSQLWKFDWDLLIQRLNINFVEIKAYLYVVYF